MIKRDFLVFLSLLTMLLGCHRAISQQYVCLPCKQPCDLAVLSRGGPCPTCRMALVEKGTYNKTLTKKQLTEDFTILVNTLQNNHPGIYDYQSKSDFEQTIQSLEKELSSAQYVLDEYKIVSKLIAAVGDAHTYVMNPYYQNILQEELLFPVIPKIDQNQITMQGERLKSINGYTEEEILERLQRFASSDGHTVPYKNTFIEMEFPLKYFTFLDDSSTFEVVFKNGTKKTWEGKSYFQSGLRSTASKPSFRIEGKTAILKIPSWEDKTASSFNNDLAAMAQQATLGKFIKASLEKAIKAQTSHLIIDLTGNKGGKSGPAALLLSYLIDEPFKYYSEISIASDSFPTKQYITNKALVDFYESKDAKNLINEVDGRFFFKKDLLPTITPNPNPFNGTVEVRVDKYSLSVSTDVVATLKKNREVKITGDEIGGSLAHYCAGNYLNLQLPNSGIEVNIPLQRLKY